LFDPAHGSYGDTILRLNDRTLTLADYFTPANQQHLDDYDMDLGSGGVMLLPPGAASATVPNLLVHTGKYGTLVIANRSNLGKYSNIDNVQQELPQIMGAIRGAPAYFNGTIYYGPGFSRILSIPIKNGHVPVTGPTGETSTIFEYTGATPSVSSNGTSNGILWAIQYNPTTRNPSATLYAYDATNLGVSLYNSSLNSGRDVAPAAIKFTTPTVVNGKVYVGTESDVSVFGLGKWPNAPAISCSRASSEGTILVSLSDSTPSSWITFTTDGSVPTQDSTRYTAPLTFSASLTIRARAFAPGFGPSPISESNYLLDSVVGNGTGLIGRYFDYSEDAAVAPTSQRIDRNIDFIWSGNSPIPGVRGSSWEGVWTGYLQAETTGMHTFYASPSAGVSLWIDHRKLIDKDDFQLIPAGQARLFLRAGIKVPIELHYSESGVGTGLKLSWSAPGLPREAIPTSQLYPAG